MELGPITCIILAAGIIALAIWLRSRRKPAPRPTAVPLPAEVPFGFTTPGGVSVASVVDNVPPEALAAIDEGITNQLERITAARPDWTQRTSLADYRVMFIEPMATNQINDPGSPALLVWGVQSAGTCIGVANDGWDQDFIVLPHQASSGWTHLDYLMHSAWHESEHIREWFNDQGVFFNFVGTGDVHPHFP